MTLKVKQRLILVTVVYWVLLVYMITALLWWFVALQNQNSLMTNMRLASLKKEDEKFIQKTKEIQAAKNRKIAQYIGEGSTFLALIIIGAIFVFRATRRQIRLSNQQNNFMMAVTHELKTPIAIAQLNLETLQKRKLDAEKQQKLITNTLQEANRLNTLCNNILLAAQLDSGKYNTYQHEINWSFLIEDCSRNFMNRYPDRNMIIDIEPNVFVLGEELLLQMLVNNLVENALKYAPKEGVIKVLLKQHQNKAVLQVADEGEGVLDEEKKQIFEKFYRSGDEKVRNAKGTGLGLYLCKKIVAQHKGQIGINNNEPKGSIFTVTINTNNDRE